MEKTHACGGCYKRVHTQETMWLELRASCVCQTDLVCSRSHTHACKFSVFVLVSVHTAHGCASFSKYELSPIDKLKRRPGSGHSNSALLYSVIFSISARALACFYYARPSLREDGHVCIHVSLIGLVHARPAHREGLPASRLQLFTNFALLARAAWPDRQR